MAELLPLDAVIFDAGGTLVRLDFEWISEMLEGFGLNIPVGALRHGEVHGRRRFDAAAPGSAGGAAEAGIVKPAPVEAYWGGMLAYAGCPEELLGAALERMRARQDSDSFLWAKPMEGARQALDALPALGLRAACVSNSDGRAEAHLERFGVREGLEFVVDSGIVGIEKPDPGIFRMALERLGVQANRALYVGDIRSVDEAGSSAAGMNFVLIDPFEDYAPETTPSLASIRELPRYITATYLAPASEERRRC